MPRANTARRGGKRPGADAPKGNFNAMRSGNRSRRMLMVYLALVSHPDQLAVGRELLAQGFILPPRGRFNGDIRGVVTYLYRRWFDRPLDGQSSSINNDQPAALQPALPASDPPAQSAEHEK